MEGGVGFSETGAGTVERGGTEGTRGGDVLGNKSFPSDPPASERETTR